MSNGIYGSAATGLQDTSWAVNDAVARVGAKGEEKTEALLGGFAKKAAILHDLRVPLPGFKANIDHIVVSGNHVLILDSKVWKPGFYWSFLGVNRRGWEKVPHTRKDQSYVQQAITGFLAGTGANVLTPRLVIWSSRTAQSPTTWMLNVPGAELVPGSSLVANVKAFLVRKPADPAIVAKLRELLVRPAHIAASATPTFSDRWDDDAFA
ncbi:nuclease-related domain-containing protein [Arthrobacter sp. A2-55]|uniref:nuclease-related domain-containing protein n=1 Tax=Arthrobacter sp. A2-55 TaxID=2897337 RepID=UPI0021CD5B36|nr:nuclease-related domain-containing protein [Arthrobacter sp. A2-55]MCU6481917.1 NERD domain-containing protein [Arthrobacter sp. A2-55]